jgi:hypothetical protein
LNAGFSLFIVPFGRDRRGRFIHVNDKKQRIHPAASLPVMLFSARKLHALARLRNQLNLHAVHAGIIKMKAYVHSSFPVQFPLRFMFSAHRYHD